MATVTSARDTATSHPYTCNACQVAFRNADIQKAHMKSDWHRYNLKRKVASLPPISSDVFNDRVLQAKEESSASAGKVAFQKPCEACKKTFYSENSYRNHLSSAKHKASEKALHRDRGSHHDDASTVISSTFSIGEPVERAASVDSAAEAEFNQVVEQLKKADIEDGEPDERPSPVKRPSNPRLSAAGQHKAAHLVSEPASEHTSDSGTPVPTQTTADNRQVTLKTCLFCSYDSPSLDLNVNHMQRIHSMFIPERDYLIDLVGLVGYLQQIVYEQCRCIACRKTKADVFAIQTHMRDASHCKIPYATEAEMLRVGDFYDFRSTYSDPEEDEDGGVGMEGNGTKLGLKRTTRIVGEDGEELGEVDEGWETDSDASSVATDEITSLPMDQHIHQYEKLDKHLHHSHNDPRKHLQGDGFHSHAHKHAHHAAFYDEYELHLPSGKSVGHRSLAKYYRQNLRDHPSPEEREMAAIEAAKEENDDSIDLDGEHQGASESTSREIVARDQMGMVGVAEYKKKEVQKVEKKAKAAEDRASRRMQLHVSERANNQKSYYYREG
ncbi:zinc finger protein Yan [Zalerion maritima]|uniref:Zinc finger protein Yan n=1 Tax=Zalerion maritima TaxID=339359 RepID=A0AAD5WT26_9PEZI|nr:zinc finger protein Yan [Zalerion maritima]